ncbi:hypothetical protein EV356DRAFT_561131 [Viridothelium virens]|uniref:Thioredoxin domain-containing protein n=1 Tax=Viridothelium virens TaxID=1048519 RepID=A0A6A6GZ92_VIRVR|nr:hypothetical protein EV356DRAFT_561131 [Viridothelium virens]
MAADQRPEPLRLGSIAPNFDAETTAGPINFHDFIGDSWVVLFSHPEDYTPVCTTELGAFAKLEPEFTKRGVKLIGLSANTIESHGGWIKDINEISGSHLRFPIIGDKQRKVAYAYDMLDHQDTTNVDSKGIAFTIRSVFIIDPKKTIRTILSYPASTGRNTAEVLRIVDSLQTGDKHKVTTPINWIPGDDVIVHPSVKTEDAQKQYPQLNIVKPYLRFTPLAKEQTSANVETSLNRQNAFDSATENHQPNGLRNPGHSQSQEPSPAVQQTAGLGTSTNATTNVSGLVCNVHRTTGREPHSLVGATTTILGDKLTRPQLISDLFELDLMTRHWTKLETKGDIPPPRYFHSVCALGDTKLVCYGGMCPVTLSPGQNGNSTNSQEPQPEFMVMSDIHIYDVPTKTWMKIQIPANESPQGRYAHCATILPSSGIFASANAPMSAINHNPSTSANSGSLGVSLDGTGDSANHYIEQVSVFNLRSLKWTGTTALGRSCGAYRSVVAPLQSMKASQIGEGLNAERSSMLLELQIRKPDGTLVERPMQSHYSPPGLRFPNGGVVNNHFVQEYALWGLDLKTLQWNRIDAGGNIFSQGSWNRGILWPRRNIFIVLGNRKRSLVEDYNHRRINFSNICMVELEAFGLYDNPRRTSPTSDFVSVSAPSLPYNLNRNSNVRSTTASGGRKIWSGAEDLGTMALDCKELADMDFLAIGGERIPVNSHFVARRWGSYFNQLLKESATTASESTDTETGTLRPGALAAYPSRNSSLTITPQGAGTQGSPTPPASSGTTGSGSGGRSSVITSSSTGTTLAGSAHTGSTKDRDKDTAMLLSQPPDPRSSPPFHRPRTLYLPHTAPTLRTLLQYLYTSALPPPTSPSCSPQILCSLLQLARPYRVDGLLEAVVQRLHEVLDGRNTAAIFNASAMAAGGGDGVAFVGQAGVGGLLDGNGSLRGMNPGLGDGGMAAGRLRINTNLSNGQRSRQPPQQRRPRQGSNAAAGESASEADGEDEDHMSNLSDTTSASESAGGRTAGSSSREGREGEVWHGGLSSVVGLQKRGLRGLMEGRRMRERGRSDGTAGPGAGGTAGAGSNGVGLGIA